MATYTAVIATHQTAATGVDTVTLSADFDFVEVLARVNSGTQLPIYFCVDGAGGPAGDGIPTVGGVDCYVVPAVGGAAVKVHSRSREATVVKLITGGSQPYSVTGVND